jgi:hypothetical protein
VSVTEDRPPAFAHRRAGHCGSGSLRDLLEHHGLDFGAGPLDEATVFGLAGGLGFLYAEPLGATPPVYVLGRTGDLERDIAPNLGLGLEVRETDDPAQAWAWVRDELDAGRPPMIMADIGDLEYLRVKMRNTRHDIVVAGYDEAAGVAYVADNDRDELQACSLTSLAAARASTGFPGPNRHATYLFTWPDALPDPRVATRRGLERAIANMRQGGAALAGLDGPGGLAGVDAFAAAYEQWPARFGAQLPEILGALWVFIVKAGTGGAMFRSLHAGFLRDMGTLLDDAAVLAAADLYDRLSDAWTSLAATAKAGDHAAGLAHVSEITRLEHAGVAAMEAAR